MTHVGRFITLEGGEGTGKSTQARRLGEWLLLAGYPVVTTREPGGVHDAEAIRDLLSGETLRAWSPMSEVLLHMAARREHVDKLIRPRLTAGCWVVCDRFVDSTAAYQGCGQGVGRGRVAELHRIALDGLMPDLTLILDAPVETAFARLMARGEPSDRYERMAGDFHNRVRDAFRAIAAEEPDRCVMVDATQDADRVTAEIRRHVVDRLGVSEYRP